MIPNGLKRKSIKAVATYILHDKDGAKTSDRVAWTYAGNIAAGPDADPELVWRQMCSTLMDRETLKAQSGHATGGQKLEYPAYHLMLMWHPTENPSKAEQIRAGKELIREMGFDEHQYLMVAHQDEPQAHIHILINRVHPVTGLAASLSMDRPKQQRWAMNYEYENGVYCFQRIENAQKREQGAYIRWQRRDGAKPENRARRARAQAELAKARISDPQYILRVLTKDQQSFTRFESYNLLVRMNAALPEAEQHAKEFLYKSAKQLEDPRFSVQLEDGKFAPRELIALEQQFVDRGQALSQDRDAFRIAADIRQKVASEMSLSDHQRQAFEETLEAGRFAMAEGIAGAGKSHYISALRIAYEDAGFRTEALGPTHAVVRDLEAAGFESVRTVHSALAQQEAPFRESDKWDARSVVFLDEAPMLGTRRLEELQRRADVSGAKLILVGDDGQFPPVQQAHKVWANATKATDAARLNEVIRQRDAGCQAITRAFSDGDYQGALKAMHQSGQTKAFQGTGRSERDPLLKRDVYDDPRLKGAVRDHIADAKDHARAGKSTEEFFRKHIITALSDEMVVRANHLIHDARTKAGTVHNSIEIETDLLTGQDTDEQREAVKISVGEGDRVRIGHNDREAGFFKGDMGWVRSTAERKLSIELDDGRTVKLNASGPGSEALRLGYAMTLIQSQGKSVDTNKAVVTQAWRGYAAYVAASRHTEPQGARFYYMRRGDGMSLAAQLAQTDGEAAAMDRLKIEEDRARISRAYPALDTTPRKAELVRLAGEERDRLVREFGTVSHGELRRAVLDATDPEAGEGTRSLPAHRVWEEEERPHSAALEQMGRHVTRDSDFIQLPGERFTNRTQLKREHDVLITAMEMRQSAPHDGTIAREEDAALLRSLNAEQYAAARGVIEDRGVAMVDGHAGVGKGRLFEQLVRDYYRPRGYDVRGLAPTAAVAGDLGKVGIESKTIHAALAQQERAHPKGKWTSNTVLMVDEAAMIGTPQMQALFKRANEAGAKVVMAYDVKQLDPVKAPSGMASALGEHLGAHRLENIQRQKPLWMQAASKDLANGRMREGLQAYADKKAIGFARDRSEAKDKLVGRYLKLTKPNLRVDADARTAAQQSAAREIALLAYRRKDVADLNTRIREARLKRGDIERGITFNTAHGRVEVSVGDRLMMTQNALDRGLRNNDVATVTSVAKDEIGLKMDRDGSHVGLDPAAYAEFRHGYATTIHGGQGKTAKHGMVLITDDMQKEAGYVAFTRHTDSFYAAVDRRTTPSMKALTHQLSAARNRPAAITQLQEVQRRELGVGLIRPVEPLAGDQISAQRDINAALARRLKDIDHVFDRRNEERRKELDESISQAHREKAKADREAYGSATQAGSDALFEKRQAKRQKALDKALAEGNEFAAANLKASIQRAVIQHRMDRRDRKDDDALHRDQISHLRDEAKRAGLRDGIEKGKARRQAIEKQQSEMVEAFGARTATVEHPSMSNDEKRHAREYGAKAYAAKPEGWEPRYQPGKPSGDTTGTQEKQSTGGGSAMPNKTSVKARVNNGKISISG